MKRGNAAESAERFALAVTVPSDDSRHGKLGKNRNTIPEACNKREEPEPGSGEAAA